MTCANKIQPSGDILGDAHNEDHLVVPSPPVHLSKGERRTLAELEAIIAKGERSFMDIGLALEKIRHGRLHRDYHKTFEAYCRGRWRFSRKRAYQVIWAAERATLLSTIVDTAAPSNESQVRPLVGRSDDEAIEIWKLANSLAAGAPVTGRLVKKAINTLFGEVHKPAKPIADLFESVLRSCQSLAEHFGDTDLSDLGPVDKERLSAATELVVQLATKAGCFAPTAGSNQESRNRALGSIAIWRALISPQNTAHANFTVNPCAKK